MSDLRKLLDDAVVRANDGWKSFPKGRKQIVDELIPAVRAYVDEMSLVVGHIECPECHEAIPFGVQGSRIEDETVVIDPDLSDLWAHYFAHST